MAIAYTSGSKGIYIGTYRGTCNLGFHGAIDDVAVWDDVPAGATTGPVIDTGARHADADRDRPCRRRRRRPAAAPGATTDRSRAELPAGDASAAATSRSAARRG